jgi:diguanylate cyclase (GGDEF)-like protein
MRLARRLLRRMSAFREWPLWSLPRWLSVFVLTVIALYVAAISAAAPAAAFSEHDLALFGLLLGCTAAAVELTRKAGEQGGMMKDVQGVWELPIAILLPPFYALVFPITRIALTQWRVRRAPLYRRVFSCAAVGLAYGAASVTFHGLSGLAPQGTEGTLSRGTVWTLLVIVSVLVKSVVNKAVIMTAVRGADPAANIRTQLFGGEPLYNDIAEICIGVLVTYGVAGNPLLALAALPVVTLLQRSVRHAQLLTDSRADSKTGLLNAATWEREAAAEVARAVRTRSPLAIALLDIDKFKAINDTHGHLVGDQVLKEIANTLSTLLRDYDLAGRFGGEEFSLLLPQTRAVDAMRIAERIRSNIAALSIIAPGAAGGERVQVTVSIGVAALDSGTERKFAQLMAAADAALYRAKACGRDQVQMISTPRGLSAVSSSSRGINGAAARNAAARNAAAARNTAAAQDGAAPRTVPPPRTAQQERTGPRTTSQQGLRRGSTDRARGRGGDAEHGDDRRAARVALRGVARAQHFRGGISLAGPAAHRDRRAATVTPYLPVPDHGGVLVLDLKRHAAVHGALGDLDDDRHVRRGTSGAAGRTVRRGVRVRQGRAARQQADAARHQANAARQQQRARHRTERPPGPGPDPDPGPAGAG